METWTVDPDQALYDNEYTLHADVVNYIDAKYPDVLFSSSLTGIRLGRRLRAKAARLQKGPGFPDLAIHRARHGYYGLYIEIKLHAGKIYRADGQTLLKDDHIKTQGAVLDKLRSEGYKAEFCCGFGACADLIDWYLNES